MRRQTVLLLLATTLALADSQVTTVDSRGVWSFSSTGVKEEREMSGAARAIVKKVLSVEQAEGVGARVRRSVGRPEES
jgi:hypothetical protein